MRQNAEDFVWSSKSNRAAQFLAEDELTDSEIAEKVGIGRATLGRWKQHPQFAARVKEIAAELGDVALRYALGRRARRVAALTDRWERMQSVIAERAAALEMQGVPGGESGVLVRTLKSIGSGPNAEKVEEFEFDAALLKELREHEKQAAVELGQWTEKREHSIPDIDALIARELERLVGAGQGAAAGTPPQDTDASAGADTDSARTEDGGPP